MPMPLLEVRHLSVRFRTDEGTVDAVRDVSFSLNKGETLAIVGESGSGKSVTALALTRLVPCPPAEVTAGEVLLDGKDTLKMDPADPRKVRGGRIAYVFQEPSTSLNPVYSIESQIAEAIRLHRPEIHDVRKEIIHWLNAVGIVEPEKRMRDYPHQLSGGMQQRAMIAMALSGQPDVLIADEPTTALDVTIQAQIIRELVALQAQLGMAIVLITHNFGIVSGFANHVAVMYRGRIVEMGETSEILQRPQHPYTKALIDCIPRLGSGRGRLPVIDLPDEVSETNVTPA